MLLSIFKNKSLVPSEWVLKPTRERLPADTLSTFISTNWSRIKGGLPEIGVPGHLTSFDENYLAEKILW